MIAHGHNYGIKRLRSWMSHERTKNSFTSDETDDLNNLYGGRCMVTAELKLGSLNIKEGYYTLIIQINNDFQVIDKVIVGLKYHITHTTNGNVYAIPLGGSSSTDIPLNSLISPLPTNTNYRVTLMEGLTICDMKQVDIPGDWGVDLTYSSV